MEGMTDRRLANRKEQKNSGLKLFVITPLTLALVSMTLNLAWTWSH